MYCIQIHRIDASHKTWTIVTVRIVDERSLQNMIYNARAFACGYITKEMGSFAATFIGYCYPISKQSRVMMISCHTTKTKTIRTAHYVFCILTQTSLRLEYGFSVILPFFYCFASPHTVTHTVIVHQPTKKK
eukprot:853664_1